MTNFRNLNIHQKINIRRAFHRWAEITEERLQVSYMKKIKRSGPGYESITLRTAFLSNFSGKATFLYNQYLMFVDMGVGKGTKIGDVAENRTVRGLLGASAARRKSIKWYTPIMGKEYYKLAPLMQEHFGDEAIRTLMTELPETLEINL